MQRFKTGLGWMMALAFALVMLVVSVAPVHAQEVVAAATAVEPAGWVANLCALLNTSSAMILFGVIGAWLVAWMFTKKPEWKKYEGLIITAIKLAEKTIPDDTANGSLKKADVALKAFIAQYEAAYGKPPSEQVKDVVAAAMPVVHDALDARGTL